MLIIGLPFVYCGKTILFCAPKKYNTIKQKYDSFIETITAKNNFNKKDGKGIYAFTALFCASLKQEI